MIRSSNITVKPRRYPLTWPSVSRFSMSCFQWSLFAVVLRVKYVFHLILSVFCLAKKRDWLQELTVKVKNGNRKMATDCQWALICKRTPSKQKQQTWTRRAAVGQMCQCPSWQLNIRVEKLLNVSCCFSSAGLRGHQAAGVCVCSLLQLLPCSSHPTHGRHPVYTVR